MRNALNQFEQFKCASMCINATFNLCKEQHLCATSAASATPDGSWNQTVIDNAANANRSLNLG